MRYMHMPQRHGTAKHKGPPRLGICVILTAVLTEFHEYSTACLELVCVQVHVGFTGSWQWCNRSVLRTKPTAHLRCVTFRTVHGQQAAIPIVCRAIGGCGTHNAAAGSVGEARILLCTPTVTTSADVGVENAQISLAEAVHSPSKCRLSDSRHTVDMRCFVRADFGDGESRARCGASGKDPEVRELCDEGRKTGKRGGRGRTEGTEVAEGEQRGRTRCRDASAV